MRETQAEDGVRDFYDSKGWSADSSGNFTDARLWEDLRPAAESYVRACRRRVLEFLPPTGDRLLDAASGPIQYPEYLEYSAGFRKRVCVDISKVALEQARSKLGDRGEYVRASLLELPFADDAFDASVSLHTIYHIHRDQQEAAVRQLIRVTRPGKPLVIVYANPDRLPLRIKRVFKPIQGASEGPIYYFAHPLSWWRRFEDRCEVALHPWRTLTAQDSRRLFPDNGLGKALFRGTLALEGLLPNAATRLGAYSVIVLRKRP